MQTHLSPAAEFKILAHRGSTEGGATENTLEALHFATDAGINYLETDVRATSDGVAILFHDPDLLRIYGYKSLLSENTLGQLNALDKDGKASIATLREALETLPQAVFNLDIKSGDAVAPTIEAIRGAKAQGRVLVTSFSPRRRRETLAGLSAVSTSADAWQVLKIWLFAKLGLDKPLRRELASLEALQVPLRYGPIRFDVGPFIQRIRQHGVEVHFWTINDLVLAERLRALGASGIVTDKGKMMVEAFRNRKR